MKIIFSSILILFSLLAFGQNIIPENTSSVDSSRCKKIILTHGNIDTISSNEFSITKVEINNGCLDVDIRYGGGCGRADLELITDGRVILTGTPQIYFVLKFTDQDLCKALVYRKISFDLGTNKNEAKGEEILILINGADKTEHSILYKY